MNSSRASLTYDELEQLKGSQITLIQDSIDKLDGKSLNKLADILKVEKTKDLQSLLFSELIKKLEDSKITKDISSDIIKKVDADLDVIIEEYIRLMEILPVESQEQEITSPDITANQTVPIPQITVTSSLPLPDDKIIINTVEKTSSNKLIKQDREEEMDSLGLAVAFLAEKDVEDVVPQNNTTVQKEISSGEISKTEKARLKREWDEREALEEKRFEEQRKQEWLARERLEQERLEKQQRMREEKFAVNQNQIKQGPTLPWNKQSQLKNEHSSLEQLMERQFKQQQERLREQAEQQRANQEQQQCAEQEELQDKWQRTVQELSGQEEQRKRVKQERLREQEEQRKRAEQERLQREQYLEREKAWIADEKRQLSQVILQEIKKIDVKELTSTLGLGEDVTPPHEDLAALLIDKISYQKEENAKIKNIVKNSSLLGLAIDDYANVLKYEIKIGLGKGKEVEKKVNANSPREDVNERTVFNAKSPTSVSAVKEDEYTDFLSLIECYKQNEKNINNKKSQHSRNKLISENKKLVKEITACFFEMENTGHAYRLLNPNEGLLKEVNTLLKQKYVDLHASISWYEHKSDETNKSILNVSLFGDKDKKKKAHQKTMKAKDILTDSGKINHDSDCRDYKRVIKNTLTWRSQTDDNNTESNIRLIAQNKSSKWAQRIKTFLTFSPIALPGALFFIWDAHKNKGGIRHVVSTEGKRVEASMEKVAKDLTRKRS